MSSFPGTVYPRYWIPVLLHGALSFLFLGYLDQKRFVSPLILVASFAAAGYGFFGTIKPDVFFEEKANIGRTLYQIRDEVTEGSIVFQEKLLWNLHPFDRKQFVVNLDKKDLGAIRSAKGFNRQIVTLNWEEQKHGSALSGPTPQIFIDHSDLAHGERVLGDSSVVFDQQEAKASISKQMRISWAKSIDFEVLDAAKNKLLLGFFRNLFGKDRRVLEVEYTLLASNGRIISEVYGPGVWMLAARIERIRLLPEILDWNITDFAPLVWASYLLPLKLLPIGPKTINAFARWNSTRDTISIQVESNLH